MGIFCIPKPLVAGSLWHKTADEAIPRSNPRHRGGPVWIYRNEMVSDQIIQPGQWTFHYVDTNSDGIVTDAEWRHYLNTRDV